MTSGPVRGHRTGSGRLELLLVGCTVVWLLSVVVFGVLLVVENRSRAGGLTACPVPGYVDSTYGVGVWQAWPPGTRCERGPNLDVAPSTPKVWDRPGAWRGAAAVLLTAAGAVLVVILVKTRDRD